MPPYDADLYPTGIVKRTANSGGGWSGVLASLGKPSTTPKVPTPAAKPPVSPLASLLTGKPAAKPQPPAVVTAPVGPVKSMIPGLPPAFAQGVVQSQGGGTWGSAVTNPGTGKPATTTGNPTTGNPATTTGNPTTATPGAATGPSWTGANPNWGAWQTGVPLYGQFTGPNGKDWGVQPRLNMAYAQLTGYTGGFGNAANNTWVAYYNALSPAMKAQVNALKSSYPANTNPITGGTTPGATGGTQQPGTGTGTTGGTGATGATGGTGTGTGAGTGTGGATGVPDGFLRTGSAAAGAALPGGVSYVTPQFAQGSGDFTGYGPASAQWGNQANMNSYYPTR